MKKVIANKPDSKTLKSFIQKEIDRLTKQIQCVHHVWRVETTYVFSKFCKIQRCKKCDLITNFEKNIKYFYEEANLETVSKSLQRQIDHRTKELKCIHSFKPESIGYRSTVYETWQCKKCMLTL